MERHEGTLVFKLCARERMHGLKEGAYISLPEREGRRRLYQ